MRNSGSFGTNIFFKIIGASVMWLLTLPSCTIETRISSLDSKVTPETPGPTITFLLSETDFEESVGTAVIEIHSDRTLTSEIKFSIGVSGTATTSDFSLQAPGLDARMFAGSSFTQIKINIVDDATLEFAETIILEIPSSEKYTLGGNSRIQVNIKPSDQPVCDPLITSNFGGGQGTTLNPYRICSMAQWDYFSVTTNSYNSEIKLESDLDFNGLSFAQVKLIGSVANPFKGVFDGNNFKIKNINVNGAAAEFGLFNRTDGNVTIKNLTLKDIAYTATAQSAILIHRHEVNGTLTLENISIDGVGISSNSSGLVFNSKGPMVVSNVTVISFGTSCGYDVGMIVGDLENHGTFSSITGSDIAINQTAGLAHGIGGLIGTAAGIPAAKISLTFTNITLDLLLGQGSQTHSIGGLVGRLFDGNASIDHVNITGAFNGRKIGGFIGGHGGFGAVGLTLEISNSGFVGTISSGNNLGAGFVAETYANTISITKSFSRGSFTSTDGDLGGFIAYVWNPGTTLIENSYSTNAINATTSGGVSGFLQAIATNIVTIKTSHFAGNVTSTSGSKGCISSFNNAANITATDVYYNSTVCTAGPVANAAYGGITGLATGSFTTATPFANWLSSVWVFVASANPKLIWEP